jgi:PAS domain S-box-containing protein
MNEIVNVLLVDDEVRNLDVLESVLASPDLRLVRTSQPDQALLSVIQEEFACIVLDIQMPNMNGIELARLIKTRKRSEQIPIIFLTAYFQEEKDVLQGYGVGAVDYLTKPINPDILKSKVGVFVDLYRTSHALARANASLALEVEQRKLAEEQLRLANNELESRVQSRTADLVVVNSELRAGEVRYRQLIHSLPAAVYTADAEGRVTLFNEAAAQLWGRTPEEGKVLLCDSAKMFQPDGSELPLEQCPMVRTLTEGRPIRGEEIIIERPDGTRRDVLPYTEPIRNSEGRIIGSVNMLVDITEQKKSEEAVRRLAAIVQFSDDAIISEDLNGVITSWNESAGRLFGYSAEEVIGKRVSILMPPERRSEEETILQRIGSGEAVHHHETVRQRKDGTVMQVTLTVSPMRNAEGKVIGGSKIVRDITERKRAELELKKAHEDLLAASRAKDDFLAALSHELRTPLNPVLLVASDAANNPALPEAVRSDFEMIRENVELEARLIDDLLDLTRITRGKIVLDKQPVDAHAILQNAITNVREEIKQKEITLNLQVNATRHTVHADAVRLQQIFWNLLKNAAKFTPRFGRITVETAQVQDERLVIRVIDTGIGMLPTELNRIFNNFAQGDHARGASSHRYGGLGLGLAISQKLAELHSGVIRAVSEGRDKGSTFMVELPLSKHAAINGKSSGAKSPVNLMPDSATKAAGRRVLLVEDHEPTRTALTDLLKRRQYEVMIAATLAEARSLAVTRTFDLLISDIGLPDGSGHDLMAELRLGGTVTGIALTGYGMEQDVALSENAGFIAHLTKPVRAQSLDAALNEAARLMNERDGSRA